MGEAMSNEVDGRGRVSELKAAWPWGQRYAQYPLRKKIYGVSCEHVVSCRVEAYVWEGTDCRDPRCVYLRPVATNTKDGGTGDKFVNIFPVEMAAFLGGCRLPVADADGGEVERNKAYLG